MLSRLKSIRHFRNTNNSLEDDTDPNLLKRKIEIKTDQDFNSDYNIIEHLGSGKFGEVKRCRELTTDQQFACKMVQIHSDMDRTDVLNEVKIMQMLRHPRLIQLYDVYSMPNCMYLVLELITGGELFERIIDENFDLNESKCGLFMKEILQGVEYIHSQKILHLDLKPENILCLTRTGYRIKIIDFGLAQIYDRKDLRVLFGTPEFVAPEIIAYDPVSPASDMWSVGVICYVLLSGLSPFMDNTEAETLNNIMRVTYSFNFTEFNEISSEAKELIKKLLQKDPKKRLSATECLSHPWIKSAVKLKRLGTISKKRLKRYFYRRKWQKAIIAIIALQRMGYSFTQGQIVNVGMASTLKSFQPSTKAVTQPGTPRKSSLTNQIEQGSMGSVTPGEKTSIGSKISFKSGGSISVHNKPPTVPSSPSMPKCIVSSENKKSPSLLHISQIAPQESTIKSSFFSSFSTKQNSDPQTPNSPSDSVASSMKKDSLVPRSPSFIQKLTLGSTKSESGKSSFMSKIRKNGSSKTSQKNSPEDTNSEKLTKSDPNDFVTVSNKPSVDDSNDKILNALSINCKQETQGAVLLNQEKKPELKLGAITMRTPGAKTKNLTFTPVPKSSRPSIEGKIGYFANLSSGDPKSNGKKQ